jgi:hypothetical protein
MPFMYSETRDLLVQSRVRIPPDLGVSLVERRPSGRIRQRAQKRARYNRMKRVKGLPGESFPRRFLFQNLRKFSQIPRRFAGERIPQFRAYK